MKDNEIKQGSAQFAIPVVVTSDAVYVHTDIEKLEPQEGTESTSETYQYHEIMYTPEEYIQLIGEENIQLNSLMNTILGVDE